jgi:hypothetical protein
MSDDADMAQDHIEREEKLRRKYTTVNKLEAESTGECLNCREPLTGTRRWCDEHCREDWEKRRR